MLKPVKYFLIILSVTSCTTEKVNLSPIADLFSKNKAKKEAVAASSPKDTIYAVDYASEITDLSASFPTFGNTSADREIKILKSNLSEYLYAVKSGNMNRKNKAYGQIKNSYSKIMVAAKFLNQDKKKVLDRYLTRIKTNLNFLENQTSGKDAAATGDND